MTKLTISADAIKNSKKSIIEEAKKIRQEVHLHYLHFYDEVKELADKYGLQVSYNTGGYLPKHDQADKLSFLIKDDKAYKAYLEAKAICDGEKG